VSNENGSQNIMIQALGRPWPLGFLGELALVQNWAYFIEVRAICLNGVAP
jgi:hypothetical protein